MDTYRIVIHRDTKAQTCRLGKFTIYKKSDESEAEDVVFSCEELANHKTGLAKNQDLALPSGQYKLKYVHSPKFSNTLQTAILQVDHPAPLVCIYNDDSDGDSSDNVDESRRILIHWGNTEKDTLGCELLGYGRSPDGITQSRAACKAFYELVYNILVPVADTELTMMSLEIIDNLGD